MFRRIKQASGSYLDLQKSDPVNREEHRETIRLDRLPYRLAAAGTGAGAGGRGRSTAGARGNAADQRHQRDHRERESAPPAAVVGLHSPAPRRSRRSRREARSGSVAYCGCSVVHGSGRPMMPVQPVAWLSPPQTQLPVR